MYAWLTLSTESTSWYFPSASSLSFFSWLTASRTRHVAFSADFPLSSSVASSLFHSRLKTHLFHKWLNASRSSARFSGKCRFDFIRVKNKLCQVNFLLDNNKKTVKMAVDLTEYKTVFYIFCSTKLLSCSFSDRFTEQLIGYHTNVVSFC